MKQKKTIITYKVIQEMKGKSIIVGRATDYRQALVIMQDQLSHMNSKCFTIRHKDGTTERQSYADKEDFNIAIFKSTETYELCEGTYKENKATKHNDKNDSESMDIFI